MVADSEHYNYFTHLQ